ncbi:MAG: hypothetical protein L6R41_000294 [Letrouitia leprolyta]|nr:MAG: hypothetical protein L6R41_000294 [Letrouitia leprolyta]
MVDDELTINQTSAGQLKREEIIKEKERSARWFQESQEEVEASLRKKEEQNVKQIQDRQQNHRSEISQKGEAIRAFQLRELSEQIKKFKNEKRMLNAREKKKFAEACSSELQEPSLVELPQESPCCVP